MTSKLSAMIFPGDDSKDKKGTYAVNLWIGEPSADARVLDTKAEQEQNDKAQSPQVNVRFASEDEEIDPLDETRWVSQGHGSKSEELSPEAHEQIRNLAMTLQKSRLQENRMSNFAYETVSMPPSRVCGTFLRVAGTLR